MQATNFKKTARLGGFALVASVFAGASAHGGLIVEGTYALSNHPDAILADPGYGLRLDELFDLTDGRDRFTFDFDHALSAMFMDYDGDSIRIYGTAFGGLDIGDIHDPANSSEVSIDFTYNNVVGVPGDDDIWVLEPDTPNTGTITWLETGEVIDLFDKANDDGWTFRFGDEDDDLGHRGFDGLSGWGWLEHHEPGFGNDGQMDWIFTGELVPGPGALALLGLGILVPGRRRRQA
jgi:hypothetical protein